MACLQAIPILSTIKLTFMIKGKFQKLSLLSLVLMDLIH